MVSITTLLLSLAGCALLTAVLASLITLKLLRRELVRNQIPALEQKAEALVERLGDVVEQRVRQGVTSAITDLPAPDVVRWTREAVTDAAGELVRGGISSLLGDHPREKKD